MTNKIDCSSVNRGGEQNSRQRFIVADQFSVLKRSVSSLMLCSIMLVSSIGYANEFATDADSILQQLSAPINNAGSNDENHSEIVSKGAFKLDGSAQSKQIDVIQEVSKAGYTTRNFAVVNRQETAPRANLRIEFDLNSANLRLDSFPLLQSLAQALQSQALASAPILINGHTDSTGKDEYNLELSFRRAQAVREYLVGEIGLSANRFSVQGFGEGAPLVNNNTAVNRQLNRRVEIERVQ